MKNMNLIDKFKQTGKKALFFGGLATASLLPQGCRTITDYEKIYGNPIQRTEELKGEQSFNYYISEVNRKENYLGVKVNKQFLRKDKLIRYDEVPVSDVKYQIRQKPTSKGMMIEIIGYPIISVLTAGLPPIYDILGLVTGRLDKTFTFNLLFGPEAVKTGNSYLDPRTKKILSKNDSIERKNEKVSEKMIVEKDMPAKNIEVRALINEPIVKITDDNGVIVFDVIKDYNKPIVIETLAKDGKNDVVELK